MIELQMLQVAYVVLQEIKSISVHILCYSTVKHYGICYILYNYKKKEKKKIIPPPPSVQVHTKTILPVFIYSIYTVCY